MSLKKNLKQIPSRAATFVNDHKVAILVTSNVATASLFFLRDLQLRIKNDYLIETDQMEDFTEWFHTQFVNTTPPTPTPDLFHK